MEWAGGSYDSNVKEIKTISGSETLILKNNLRPSIIYSINGQFYFWDGTSFKIATNESGQKRVELGNLGSDIFFSIKKATNTQSFYITNDGKVSINDDYESPILVFDQNDKSEQLTLKDGEANTQFYVYQNKIGLKDSSKNEAIKLSGESGINRISVSSSSTDYLTINEKGIMTASSAKFTSSNVQINLNPNCSTTRQESIGIVSASTTKLSVYNNGDIDCKGSITASGLGLFTQSSVAVMYGKGAPPIVGGGDYTPTKPIGSLYIDITSTYPLLYFASSSHWWSIGGFTKYDGT
jgi:hypothetical protein